MVLRQLPTAIYLLKYCVGNGVLMDLWFQIGLLWLNSINHGVAENRAEAASIALHAGVDMDMCSDAYVKPWLPT